MAASSSNADPREALRAVTPKLMDLTEKVLFGDVWERPGLSKRDRSLITVAVLTALYRPEQLRGHIQRALANGVTKDEIGEIITHLAFYSGWPTAVTAASVAKRVFDEQIDRSQAARSAGAGGIPRTMAAGARMGVEAVCADGWNLLTGRAGRWK